MRVRWAPPLSQNFRSAPCPTEQPLPGTEQQLRATERDLKRKCMDGAMADLLRSVVAALVAAVPDLFARRTRPVRWRVALPQGWGRSAPQTNPARASAAVKRSSFARSRSGSRSGAVHSRHGATRPQPPLRERSDELRERSG